MDESTLPTLEQSNAEERRLLCEKIEGLRNFPCDLRNFPCDLRTNWALNAILCHGLNEASIRLRFNLARGVFHD